MKGLVYEGPKQVAMQEVPDAKVQGPLDAVPLDEAPDAYDKFDRRVEGYTKVLLKPHG